MRSRIAWRRWQEARDPRAREALLRSYQHLAPHEVLCTMLETFSGRPGHWTRFVQQQHAHAVATPLEPERKLELPRPVLARATVSGPTWRRALAVVLRVAGQYLTRADLSAITVSVAPGELCLLARDWHRTALITLRAPTAGVLTVAVPRSALQLGLWGRSGCLQLAEDRVTLTRPDGTVLSAPATPAVLPLPDDDLGLGGCVVGRDELMAALATAPPIVELRTDVGTLLVGDTPIPVTYAAGTFTALLATRFLRDVLKGADDSVVSLELIGGWEGPVRLESGSLVALIAQRTREPLISLGR
jgi:hypothetical protein